MITSLRSTPVVRRRFSPDPPGQSTYIAMSTSRTLIYAMPADVKYAVIRFRVMSNSTAAVGYFYYGFEDTAKFAQTGFISTGGVLGFGLRAGDERTVTIPGGTNGLYLTQVSGYQHGRWSWKVEEYL